MIYSVISLTTYSCVDKYAKYVSLAASLITNGQTFTLGDRNQQVVVRCFVKIKGDLKKRSRTWECNALSHLTSEMVLIGRVRAQIDL